MPIEVAPEGEVEVDPIVDLLSPYVEHLTLRFMGSTLCIEKGEDVRQPLYIALPRQPPRRYRFLSGTAQGALLTGQIQISCQAGLDFAQGSQETRGK
jgi:hypothetical protein